MKLFTVKLTDEERALLEAERARRGLRSQADAVRVLIRLTALDHPTVMRADEASPLRPLAHDMHTSETVAKATAERRGSPIKSRLKGEWKAP